MQRERRRELKKHNGTSIFSQMHVLVSAGCYHKRFEAGSMASCSQRNTPRKIIVIFMITSLVKYSHSHKDN